MNKEIKIISLGLSLILALASCSNSKDTDETTTTTTTTESTTIEETTLESTTEKTTTEATIEETTEADPNIIRTNFKNLYFDVNKNWEVKQDDENNTITFKFKYDDKDVILFISALETIKAFKDQSTMEYMTPIMKFQDPDSILDKPLTNRNGIDFVFGLKQYKNIDSRFFGCFNEEYSYIINYASTGQITKDEDDEIAKFFHTINFGE